jgi:putative DNA primase/helicase
MQKNNPTNIKLQTQIPPVKINEKLPQADKKFVVQRCYEEEYGDAKLFFHLYKNRIVYDHTEKAWYIWGGHAWKKDKTNMVKRLVAGQLASQYLHASADLTREAEATAIADPEKAKEKQQQADKLIARTFQLRKLNRTRNVLEFANSFLGITGEEWDSTPWLLGVKNGVIHLKTGECRAGQPTDYIRTVVPTKWKGLDYPAPLWEQALYEILAENIELTAFFSRLWGYGLSGQVTEHIFPILWGAGRNGKDTLLEVLGEVLGSLAESVSTDVMVESNHRTGAAQPHIYDLRGKRLVWASETNENVRLNAGQVKLITGGGRIKTRPLYGNMIEFKPTHLLLLITNHKPKASADDYALWKRIILIPFTQRFINNPKLPNERKRDPNIKEKILDKEKSGILAWLVRGCLAWQREGLNPPPIVTNATDEYQREEDTLTQFIDDRCLVSPTGEVRANELYQAYKDWAIETGLRPMSGITFGKRIAEKFQREKRRSSNYYLGIALTIS